MQRGSGSLDGPREKKRDENRKERKVVSTSADLKEGTTLHSCEKSRTRGRTAELNRRSGKTSATRRGV